jgi:ribonuclease HI
VKLYSDGGARGNPGPASGAAILFDTSGNEVFSKSEYFGVGTNNQAEYKALLLGLRECSLRKVETLSCFLDSELVVKQLNKEYKVKDPVLLELFADIQQMLPGFKQVTFTHIPRAQNKLADKKVNEILDLHM